jgi:hypothetical protein
MTSSRTPDRHFSRSDRQKLSAAGLVLTTALLLVMAGVAAGFSAPAPHNGDGGPDIAAIKAEMMNKALSPDTGANGGGHAGAPIRKT